jgi:hypothetical protein
MKRRKLTRSQKLTYSGPFTSCRAPLLIDGNLTRASSGRLFIERDFHISEISTSKNCCGVIDVLSA